jgi:hypothetical protein
MLFAAVDFTQLLKVELYQGLGFILTILFLCLLEDRAYTFDMTKYLCNGGSL